MSVEAEALEIVEVCVVCEGVEVPIMQPMAAV